MVRMEYILPRILNTIRRRWVVFRGINTQLNIVAARGQGNKSVDKKLISWSVNGRGNSKCFVKVSVTSRHSILRSLQVLIRSVVDNDPFPEASVFTKEIKAILKGSFGPFHLIRFLVVIENSLLVRETS